VTNQLDKMSKIKQLKKFSLNKKEAITYLALLKLGPATIASLSRETTIFRTTLYYSIQRLKKKGFVFERFKNKKRYFSARDPRFLKKKTERKLQTSLKAKNDVGGLIKSLKKLSKNPPSFSSVRFFEGKESVWQVFEEILKTNKDSLWFGFGKKFLHNYDFETFVENFTKKRRQYGRTKSYNIIPSFKGVVMLAKRGETDFQEFRFLDEDKDFEAGICVFGDKIAIFSYDRALSATIIEGSAVSEIARAMFFMIWNGMK